MTVALDKKQIHLGWEVAVTILIFTIGTTWGAAVYTSNRERKQDNIIQQLSDIKKILVVMGKKDSIQDIRLDTLSNWHMGFKYDVKDIKHDVQDLKEAISRSHATHYFTERKDKEGLQFNEVKR